MWPREIFKHQNYELFFLYGGSGVLSRLGYGLRVGICDLGPWYGVFIRGFSASVPLRFLEQNCTAGCGVMHWKLSTAEISALSQLSESDSGCLGKSVGLKHEYLVGYESFNFLLESTGSSGMRTFLGRGRSCV